MDFLNFSNICCMYTLELPHRGNSDKHLQHMSIQLMSVFDIIQVFTNFSTTFMFQCNENVEMNKFLCSLACTWMTIIDSQLYITESLSLDVSLELNANLVFAWL